MAEEQRFAKENRNEYNFDDEGNPLDFEIKDNKRNYLYYYDQYEGFLDEQNIYYDKEGIKVQQPEDSNAIAPTLPKFDINKEELLENLQTYSDANQLIIIEYQGFHIDSYESDILKFLGNKLETFFKEIYISEDVDNDMITGELIVYDKKKAEEIIQYHQTKQIFKSDDKEVECVVEFYIKKFQTILDMEQEDLQEALDAIIDKPDQEIEIEFLGFALDTNEQEIKDYFGIQQDIKIIYDDNIEVNLEKAAIKKEEDIKDIQEQIKKNKVVSQSLYETGSIIVKSKKDAQTIIEKHSTEQEKNNQKYLVKLFVPKYEIDISGLPLSYDVDQTIKEFNIEDKQFQEISLDKIQKGDSHRTGFITVIGKHNADQVLLNNNKSIKGQQEKDQDNNTLILKLQDSDDYQSTQSSDTQSENNNDDQLDNDDDDDDDTDFYGTNQSYSKLTLQEEVEQQLKKIQYPQLNRQKIREDTKTGQKFKVTRNIQEVVEQEGNVLNSLFNGRAKNIQFYIDYKTQTYPFILQEKYQKFLKKYYPDAQQDYELQQKNEQENKKEFTTEEKQQMKEKQTKLKEFFPRFLQNEISYIHSPKSYIVYEINGKQNKRELNIYQNQAASNTNIGELLQILFQHGINLYFESFTLQQDPRKTPESFIIYNDVVNKK